MLNSSSCGCVVSKKTGLNSTTNHPVWRWSAILSKKAGLNSKDLPSSVEVVCYPQQEGRVEFKGLWEHTQHLSDTVQELEEDGRPLVGIVRVTQTMLELVAKGKPLLLYQDLHAQQ